MPPLAPSNPFTIIKAREVIYGYCIVGIMAGSTLRGLQQLTDLSADDPFWTSISYGLLMLPLAGWFLWRVRSVGGNLQYLWGRVPKRMRWGRLFGLTITTLMTSLGLFMLFTYLWYSISPDSMAHLFDRMLRLKSSLRPANSVLPEISKVLTLITVIIVAPLTEEFIFRGILLQRWATKWNLPIALILSSILFGLLHLNSFGAGILGLVVGVLYCQTKSLWVPVAFHATNNTIASLSIVLPPNLPSTASVGAMENVASHGWTGFVWVCLAAPWVIQFLRRNFPRKDALIPYLRNQIRAYQRRSYR